MLRRLLDVQVWSGKQLVDTGLAKKFIVDNTKGNKGFKKMKDFISAWKYYQDGTSKDTLKK